MEYLASRRLLPFYLCQKLTATNSIYHRTILQIPTTTEGLNCSAKLN
jgi:hypothetical protein